LAKQGWRPKRTIIYAAWDGEEPGLIGSTEWVETHAKELEAHAVAYLNSDTNGRGYFGVAGSHTLEKFMNGVARDVDDPETGASLWKRQQASLVLDGSADERRDARDRDDLRLEALGSGSDYSSFIDHVGVASLNLGFGGEDDGGIYHSAYDDFYWFTHFSDSSFVYGRALAQATGIAVLRLANADVLPFGFTNLAETVRGYVKELQALRETRAEQITERNRRIDDGVFKLTNDPRHPTIALPRQKPAPQLNFAPLLNALDSLTAVSTAYEKAYGRAVDEGRTTAARQVNERLIQAERALTSSQGLKSRSWYTHLLYAPGFYTGYGVKTVPGVREAIEQGEWPDADREIARAAEAILREATLVGGLVTLLRGS
jgi:N-acetylated-alpha-linked acidic dipeptidase